MAAISLVIVPADLPTLSVPAAAGAAKPAGYPDSVKLSAVVWLQDHSTTSAATWTSDLPGIATVSSTGLVKAVGMGSGRGPWTVPITARSLDKRVSYTREILVQAVGDLELRVE